MTSPSLPSLFDFDFSQPTGLPWQCGRTLRWSPS